jgi:hypothetical protein
MEEIMFKKIILATLVLTIVNPVAFAEKAKRGSMLEKACNAQLGDDLEACGNMPGAYAVPHPPAVDKCVAKASRDYKSCTTMRTGGLDNYENAIENSSQFEIQRSTSD